MNDEESSKSENEINLDEDESFDEEQPNLFQINRMIDKKKKEDMNTLLKKKKKKSEPQDIIFDANKKKIIGCYCPDLEELENFLKNCEIREIKDEEYIQKDIPKENIFDPEAFVEKYYENINPKQPISVEELCLKIQKIDLNIPELVDVNPEIYVPEPKIILNGNELMKSMIEKEILDTKQRKDFNELITEIKKMDIKAIIKEDKLDIIFDLDNTCIYAFIIKLEDYMNLKKKYPEKKMKLFNLYLNDKIVYFCLIIREGLREFINYTKEFCNFHINTLGIYSYGEALKNILEKELGIKFIKFKARKERETKKFLEHLDLKLKNCVIFDDQPSVWVKDELNVIISKRFIEKDFFYFLYKMGNNQNFNLELFLSNYLPFFFYKYGKNKYEQINLKKQKIYSGRLSPFYQFKETNDIKQISCYTGECLESSKKQFIYMKEVVKIIYYFVFNYDIHVSDIIKFIRYNIFYKNYFSLKFYKGEGKNILIDTIEACGGEIFNERNNIKDYKLFFVCRKDDYSKLRDKIEKELFLYENALVVSDKYIVDSFYFMTNLEDELNDPEYLLFNKNKENDNDNDFDNY